MATASKTWSFNSDTQGWVATVGTPGMSSQWQSNNTAPGDPGGCLEMTQAGDNVNPESNANYWEFTGSWESIFGIPSGSTVTTIGTPDDYSWNCPTFAFGGVGNVSGPFELRDSGGGLQATLSASTGFSGVSPSWQSQAGSSQAVPLGQQPSNTTIKLRLSNTLSVSKNASAVVRLQQDKITITITYTAGAGQAYDPSFFRNRPKRRRNPATFQKRRKLQWKLEPYYTPPQTTPGLFSPALFKRRTRKRNKPGFQKRRKKYYELGLFPATVFASALFKRRTRKRNPPGFQKRRKKFPHVVIILNVFDTSIHRKRRFKYRPKPFARRLANYRYKPTLFPAAVVDTSLFRKRRYKYRVRPFSRKLANWRYKGFLYPGFVVPSALFRKKRFKYRPRPFFRWTKRRYREAVYPGALIPYPIRRRRRRGLPVFARRRADYRFKIELFPVFMPPALFFYRPWMKWKRKVRYFNRTIRRKQRLFQDAPMSVSGADYVTAYIRRKRRRMLPIRPRRKRLYAGQLYPGAVYDSSLLRRRKRRARVVVRSRSIRTGRILVNYLPRGVFPIRSGGTFQEPARGGF